MMSAPSRALCMNGKLAHSVSESAWNPTAPMTGPSTVPMPPNAGVAEADALSLHAIALTSRPPILYWQPASVAALATVRRLRDEGVLVCPTMDAGPHVKAICLSADVERVERALAETEGVLRTVVAQPGPGIEIEVEPS